MDDKCRVVLENKPDMKDIQALVQGLAEFNAGCANGEKPGYLIVTVRDAKDDLVGGLVGATYLGWLQIQVVWLKDSARGQGYGRALMDMAESEVLRRGDVNAFVET